MRRYVLSEDTIIEESQRVTTIHPLFDAVGFYAKKSFYINHIPQPSTAVHFCLISVVRRFLPYRTCFFSRDLSFGFRSDSRMFLNRNYLVPFAISTNSRSRSIWFRFWAGAWLALSFWPRLSIAFRKTVEKIQ